MNTKGRSVFFGLLMLLMALLMVAPTALAGIAVPEGFAPGDVPVLGFPDNDSESGRFAVISRGLSSLGDTVLEQDPEHILLEIPVELSEFQLGIFDGRTGTMWDSFFCDPDDMVFQLYRDPDGIGNTASQDLIVEWTSDTMPADDWFIATVAQDPGAYSEARHAYIYHLAGKWLTTACENETNALKVIVQGIPFLRAGSTIGIEAVGVKEAYGDYPIIGGDYDGAFPVVFYVPESTDQVTLYDGDFDVADDTDDPNTPDLPANCGSATGVCPDTDGDGVPDYDPAETFPPFPTSPLTLAQGANPGALQDDAPDIDPAYDLIRYTPNVYYTVTSPSGWTVTNDNPSGNQEWEMFRIGVPGSDPDAVQAPSMPQGYYIWGIVGLDAYNAVFMQSRYDTFPKTGIMGDFVWQDADGNGEQGEGELGIEGVLLELLDANGDVIRTTITGVGGIYRFMGYAAGTYTVQIADANFDGNGPLDGYSASPQDNGADDALDSDGDTANHRAEVNIAENEIQLTVDFGFVPPCGPCEGKVTEACHLAK
ncbi:MAG: hypothetical protein JRK53_11595 [Deltaproteobacteria bacterium]|nr:hypothetical protein [Deltaproteobacteria bacterium]